MALSLVSSVQALLFMLCDCSYWNIRAALAKCSSPHGAEGPGERTRSNSLDGVLLQVEFGVEAKVGEDTWLALGIPANQSRPEMRNSDAVLAGVMSPSMLLAAAPSPRLLLGRPPPAPPRASPQTSS